MSEPNGHGGTAGHAPSGSLTRARILTATVPTLAAAALAAWLGATVGGAAAGVLGAASVVLVAIASLSWPWRRSGGSATSIALALALAGLVLFLAFNAGGFFPGSTATATVGLLIALCLRLALAEDPVAGFGRLLGLAALAIALLAAWQALSATWSGASARALLEADRTLLYLSALLFFGSFARSRARLEWLVRGLALALLCVCLAGLGVWLLPDRFAAPESFAPNRLSLP
jgi:hypothetical protein